MPTPPLPLPPLPSSSRPSAAARPPAPDAAVPSDPLSELRRSGGQLWHDVQIQRSARRTRSASARLVDGRVVVRVPANLSAEVERRLVDDVLGKLAATQHRELSDAALAARARRLSEQLFDGALRPSSVTWSDRQQRSRWGSCSTGSRRIRISSRVARFPSWVIDYVVVHELAHLVEAQHSPRFWALVDRYPRAAQARGFLQGFSYGRGWRAEDDAEDEPPEVGCAED